MKNICSAKYLNYSESLPKEHQVPWVWVGCFIWQHYYYHLKKIKLLFGGEKPKSECQRNSLKNKRWKHIYLGIFWFVNIFIIRIFFVLNLSQKFIKKSNIIFEDLFIFTFVINKISHTLTHSRNSGSTTDHHFFNLY
mgnify:CR=1 FL=1